MVSTPHAPARLITMPHSHYSEKARWALDYLGLDYREEPHVPLLHWWATSRCGGRSVPVLIHAGQHYLDSTDILRHLDAVCGGDRLFPREAALNREVCALEHEFDDVLGPHARRWAYAHLLPHERLLRTAMSRGVPRFEARLLPLLFPLAKRLIRSRLRITPESARRSLERVHAVFAQVGDRLRDGRRYLVGDRFSAADIAFAALSAPVLFPDGYGGALPALAEMPAAMGEEVMRLREAPAGAWSLRLFAQERLQPAARNAT